VSVYTVAQELSHESGEGRRTQDWERSDIG